MRLPNFRLYTPTSLREAVKILANEAPSAMLLAGGTDLLPNMKRGQQEANTLVSLRRIESLRRTSNENGLTLGAGLTISELAANDTIKSDYTALAQAASLIATPILRNMGTLGGNICLDTRCNYYNQNEDWRKAINYCLKKDGETCWVSTAGKTCCAVSSTDSAPALISLGARVRLVSNSDERLIDMKDLYRNDGANYLRRRGDEILSEVILEPLHDWRSTYWKLRQRGSFDFPLLSVAAAIHTDPGKTIDKARIVLGAVSSQPLVCEPVEEFLCGKKLHDDVIEEAGQLLIRLARPRGNTDLTPIWRKKMAAVLLRHALCELRGDNMRRQRQHIARQRVTQ